MNKQDLIAVVAETGDLPRARATSIVDAFFDAIEKGLTSANEVRLVGFGTFSIAERKGGKGRNPRTGDEIEIKPSTTVRFKPGKQLKDAVTEARAAKSAAPAAPARKGGGKAAMAVAAEAPAKRGGGRRAKAADGA